MPGPLTRRWAPPHAVELAVVVAPLQRGGGDPTGRRTGDGTFWRAHRTPAGPVTLALRQLPDGTIEASAEGPGAPWTLERLPTYLGGDDDVSDFRPAHPLVAEAHRRRPGWRPLATGLVLEALVPAVIEQKVTGDEAFRGYRLLVRRYGEPAPGRGEGLRLVVPPDARTWSLVPSWEWLQAGVDGARSATVVRAARVADRLEECVGLDRDQATRRLRAIPGIGVWTAAEIRQRALGDADAVSFGDYHLARVVGNALVGRPLDDEGLARLLEPDRGHRHRVTSLVRLEIGDGARRGHRMSRRTHLPTRR